MAALGDAIMASPAVRLLRETAPNAKIAVLAKSPGARYFSRLEWIDEVIVFPASRWIDRDRLHLLPLATPSVVSTLTSVRRSHFDAVIQWRMDGIDSLIAWMAGAQVRVAASHRYLGASVRRDEKFERRRKAGTMISIPDGLHLAEVMAIPARVALESLGFENVESAEALGKLEFPIKKDEETAADEFLARHGLRDFVHVSISSETVYNRWSAEKWVKVVDGIFESTGLPILIDGLARDQPLEAEICSLARCLPVRGCGRLGLGEAGRAIQRARCLVSFNSAPIHMAAALGTPVVVINGRDGYAMSPWKTRNIVVTVNSHYPFRHPDRGKWGELITNVPEAEVIKAAIKLVSEEGEQ